MHISKPIDVVAMLIALAVVITMLPGCAVLEKLPPATTHVMDSQERCIEQHVWDTTGRGFGTQIEDCSAITGWSQERRALDER